MSKEFEALEYFKSAYNSFLKTTNNMFCQITISREQANEFVEEVEVVEKALLELQTIKEANHSEALKCLEHIKKDDFNMIITTYPPLPAYNGVTKDEMFDKIEQALLKAEKDEKIILGIEDYLNRRIKVEPLGDVRKAFIEIRNQLQVIKEVVE